MGDLTELIRAEIEAKRKEVQKRHEQSCEELNDKANQEYKTLREIEKELEKSKKFIVSLEEEEETAAGIDNDDENNNNESLSIEDINITTVVAVNNNNSNNNHDDDDDNNNKSIINVDDIINKIESIDNNDNNNGNKNDGDESYSSSRNGDDLYLRITTNNGVSSYKGNMITNNNSSYEDIMEMNSSSNENTQNKEPKEKSNRLSSSPSSPSSLSSSSPFPLLSGSGSNDPSKSFPNHHLTNRKMEISKAYDRRKELLIKHKKIIENKQKINEKLKREREAYQKTLQEHDEFERKLTKISEEFESEQNRTLLDLVKELNDNNNRADNDHEQDKKRSHKITTGNVAIERKNKRKNEEISDGDGEVHVSKKAKYVAVGVLLGLAPWIVNNLPSLQQHFQSFPFI